MPDFPRSHKHDQVRVCNINVCSIISCDKQLQLHQVIETYKPYMILGCETHHKEDINSDDIFPEEFFYSPLNCKDRVLGKRVEAPRGAKSAHNGSHVYFSSVIF